MEFGRGFAFVGQQYPVELNGETYWIDLLFYNVKLHAFMVVELKAQKFKPEFAGQLNFYLNLIDDFVKTPQDNKTIGLLLCKSADRVVAEYSLKGLDKPIGVAEYQLTKSIPSDLESSLPSIEELEAELKLFDESEGDKDNE
jgi:hypothetical protein